MNSQQPSDHKLSHYETDILKGIAILSVVINHFINDNVADKGFDFLYLSGYANGLIVIFFILSGYGIYHSLSKSETRETGGINWKEFYLKRALRIYPLFIIAVVAYSLISNGPALSLSSLFFINSPFWFVDAIVYCYFLTPLFVAILNKLSFNRFVLLMSLVTFALALGSFMSSGYTFPIAFILYRYILFSFVIAYVGGMALMKYREDFSKIRYLDFTGVYLGIFILFVCLTRTPGNLIFQILSGVIFIFGSLLFIASILKTQYLKNTKLKLLPFLGEHSYPIYLFQPVFYGLIYEITDHNVVYSLTGALICFPVFLSVCYFMEKTLNNGTNKLIELIIRH